MSVTNNGSDEETPTKLVVNVIWPVAGVPQTVQVQAGHVVPITVAGRDTGQGPLTFQVLDPRGRGTLRGSPPTLTYAAPAGFSRSPATDAGTIAYVRRSQTP